MCFEGIHIPAVKTVVPDMLLEEVWGLKMKIFFESGRRRTAVFHIASHLDLKTRLSCQVATTETHQLGNKVPP
jgi:hypothetical protein